MATQPHRPWQQFADELARRGLSVQWLAQRLQCTPERFINWHHRGVPATAWPELAEALGRSLDWVAGLESTREIAPVRDPETEQVAALFESMSRDERSRVLVFMLTLVNASRVARAPANEPAVATHRAPHVAGQRARKRRRR